MLTKITLYHLACGDVEADLEDSEGMHVSLVDLMPADAAVIAACCAAGKLVESHTTSTIQAVVEVEVYDLSVAPAT